MKSVLPFNEKYTMSHKYFRYLHKPFTVVSAIKLSMVHLDRTIIIKVSFLGYVINSSGDGHCQQCASPEE